MLNLDPSKLLIIAVVAVILLGPDKLPQVARQVGAAWRSFGEFRTRMESEVRSSIPDLPSSADIARLARSPSALLNHLSNMGPAEDGATPTSEDPSGDEQSVPGDSDADPAAASAAPDSLSTPTDTMLTDTMLTDTMLTDTMPPTPAQPSPTVSPTPSPAAGDGPAPAPGAGSGGGAGDPSLN